jgi:hypothetical protein
MTSPLHQAPTIKPGEGADLVPDHLCALGLALAQEAGATTTIMSTKTMTSQVQPPFTQVEVFVLQGQQRRTLPSPGQKQYCLCHLLHSEGKEEAHPEIGNCASREIKCPCVCLCSR